MTSSSPPSSDDKVRKLGAYKAPYEPEPKVVALLEKLLAQAKDGSLRAIAVATVHRDDVSPAGEANSGWAVGNGCYFAITHAMQQLYRAWGKYCDERAGN